MSFVLSSCPKPRRALFPLPIYQSFPILPSHKRCHENARCLIPMPCHCGYISFPSSTFAGLPAFPRRVRGAAMSRLYFSLDRRGKWWRITATSAANVDCSPSFFQRAVECVIEDVAQRKQAYEVTALVDDNKTVHARFADRVEDCIQAVV